MSDPPELVAELHLQLGTALTGARELDRAQQELESAIASAEGFERATYVALSARTTRLGVLGMTRQHQAVIDAATETLPEAIEHFGPQSLIVAGLYINRGTAQTHLGHYEDAVADLKRGLAGDRNASAQLGVTAAQALHNLGLTLTHLGRTDEALTVYREAYDRKLELLGDDSRSASTTANNLGYLLLKLDRPREALLWLHPSPL